MNIADQLDTQLRATNVVKLSMRRGSVGTHLALRLFLGMEATPLDVPGWMRCISWNIR